MLFVRLSHCSKPPQYAQKGESQSANDGLSRSCRPIRWDVLLIVCQDVLLKVRNSPLLTFFSGVDSWALFLSVVIVVTEFSGRWAWKECEEMIADFFLPSRLQTGKPEKKIAYKDR